MKSYVAVKLNGIWQSSLLSQTRPARHPRLTMLLLVLDVVFGVSVLDVLFVMDAHADAALDLAEAGALSVRNCQGCATATLPTSGKPMVAV